MQLSLSQTPKSISSANYLLRQYGGAAAAYSLQRLDTSTTNVVRARRSTDDAESNFTAEEVSGGSLREFALNNDADLIAFADGTSPRMYFDGSDDRVNTGYQADATSDFFVSAKVMLDASYVPNDTIFSDVGGSERLVQLFVNNTGNLQANVDSSSGVQAVAIGATTLSVGVIYDVRLAHTASTSTLDIYLDGVLEATGTYTGTFNTANYGSITIGAWPNNTQHWSGIIYDVNFNDESTYQGYGNTNGDWEDQVGSNDGTVLGSPALFSGQGFDAYVTTWYDQSGNGRDATQATAASQPQIVADGVVVTDANGNAAISFDGVNDWLDHSYNVTVTSQSHFFVSQVESGAAGSSRMYAMAVGTNADVNSADLHIPVLKNSTLEQIAVFDGGYIGASSITYGSPFLWTVLHSGSLISPFLDGSARPTGARTLNAAVTRQFIGAGCNTGTGPFLYMECTMAEMIVYDNANKSADRTAIESNIANRYGITLA